MATGQATDLIVEELRIEDDNLREQIDVELQMVIKAARRAADRDNERLAMRPTWELAAQQACKRLRKLTIGRTIGHLWSEPAA